MRMKRRKEGGYRVRPNCVQVSVIRQQSPISRVNKLHSRAGGH